MAKLADALDLGSSGPKALGGSTPPSRTKGNQVLPQTHEGPGSSPGPSFVPFLSPQAFSGFAAPASDVTAIAACVRASALRTSSSATIRYRWNTLTVLWPVIRIATD